MKQTDPFFEEFKQKPQVSVELPGVMNFLGTYAESCNGLTLCAADSRRCLVSLAKRSDNQVSIKNNILSEVKSFTLSSLRFKKEDKWANLSKALIQNIAKYTELQSGFDCLLDGDIVKNGGMIFEVASTVGIAMAVNKLFKLDLSNQIIQDCVYSACNSIGGEKKALSTIQTMMFAKKGCFVLCNTNNGMYELVKNPFKDDITLLLVESNVPSDSLEDLYEDVSYNCNKAMAEFNNSYHRNSFINMKDTDFSDKIYPISGETRQICTFLYEEYKSALQIRKNMDPLDCVMVGRALSKVQRAISDKLEVTCPEIEWIVKRAYEVYGCYGCKTLLNPGNIVVLLLQTKCVDSFINKIEDYEHIFGLPIKTRAFSPDGCATVVEN